jgi:hypothetical protein
VSLPVWTAPIALAGVAAVWIAVQHAWRRAFPDPHADPDPLAGRMGCHGCSHDHDCDHECDRPPAGGDGSRCRRESS